MLKASRGEPEKYKLRYIGVKAACLMVILSAFVF